MILNTGLLCHNYTAQGTQRPLLWVFLTLRCVYLAWRWPCPERVYYKRSIPCGGERDRALISRSRWFRSSWHRSEYLTMMVFLIPLSPPTKLKFPSTMTNSNTLYKVQGLVGLKQDNISSIYKVQGLVGLKLDNISWHELNLDVSRIKESYSILRSFMTCGIFRWRPIFRSEFSFMINFYVSYSLCCLIFPRKYS